MRHGRDGAGLLQCDDGFAEGTNVSDGVCAGVSTDVSDGIGGLAAGWRIALRRLTDTFHIGLLVTCQYIKMYSSLCRHQTVQYFI